VEIEGQINAKMVEKSR